MEIIASYYTDVGRTKQINQDSLSVKVVNSPKGKIVFAIVCDGMGGLEQGELASKEVVVAMNRWFDTRFAKMVATNTVSEELIYTQWRSEIDAVNDRLADYARKQGLTLGTTVTALLTYQNQYYVCHVGDSRLYQVGNVLQRITVDHTLVAQEVRMGIITEEQAKVDPRRSILLQCVGASTVVEPQFDCGELKDAVTFILCSDGFVHLVTEEELQQKFNPGILSDKDTITSTCREMIRLVMNRGERDNITVVGIVVRP
ncbi:MAG: serine/threonine-protein phosphatase [Lachnospiraceae bacterium]|nr:serine/threonine-protein phosphatase [Lachnospiraceae bacterium]